MRIARDWLAIGFSGLLTACSGSLKSAVDPVVSVDMGAPAMVDLASSLGEGDPCQLDGANPCGPGLGCCAPCCVPGAQPVCTPLAANSAGIGVGQCPLPDLVLDENRLRSEIGIGPASFRDIGCSVMESCVQAPGIRRLLHFSVVTPNLGTADLFLGKPGSLADLFEYSSCHDHYHFQGYALYRLLDSAGQVVLTGRKRAFCLEDFERQDDPPLTTRKQPRYTCENQGISVGWTDTYANGLKCQFLDITDLAPGQYTLEVTVNPDRFFPELSYDNNVATAPVEIAPPTTSPTDPCVGQVEGLNRECGWLAAGTYSCTPGVQVSVGCGASCDFATACDGDPILRVCDGAGACASPGLGENDDCNRDSQCSRVAFDCPASGQYTVLTAPFKTTDTVTCEVAATP
jgi:hypothetical protein